MDSSKTTEAWVKIPTEEEMRAQMPPDTKMPYNFGYVPAMVRLVATHEQIGPKLMDLAMQSLFAPGHLSRAERELVASVSAAAQNCAY